MKFLTRVLIVICVAAGHLYGGNSQANALLRDTQGRILVAGLANNLVGGVQNSLVGLPQNSPDRTTDFAAARYLPDGSLDTTFNPTGPIPGVQQINFQDLLQQPNELVLQPLDEGITSLAFTADNKIIAVGFAASGFNSAFAIARINENGGLDPTFNASMELGPIPGVALISFGILTDLARGVAVDSQGRVVVVGSSDNGQNIDLVVVRLTPDGRLDPTFNPQSPVVGSPQFNPNAVTTGAQTPLFRSPGVFVLRDEETVTPLTNQRDQSASAVVLTSDNSILVGGSLDNVDFTVDVPELNTDYLIVKLTPTGVLDTTFNAESSTPGIVTQDFQVFDDQAFALQTDSNDRIIIGGLTNNANTGDESNNPNAGITTQTSFGLARYNANGTLDETFNAAGTLPGSPGTIITTINNNFLSELRGLVVQADNKIVATGFTTSLDNTSFVTVRYTEAGGLDPTFNNGSGTPGIVVTTVQPSEDTLNDTAINAINQAFDVVLGESNEVFITGLSFDGIQNNFTTINYVASGALDTTFNPNGDISGQPGIVITKFGEALSSLGNGVPIEVTEDLTGVASSIIEDLTYPPLPFSPFIYEQVLEAFSYANRVLAGQASPNAVISVFVDDVQAAVTTANKMGEWDATLPFLPNGSYKVTIVAMDPLTGVSLASSPVSLAIDNEGLTVPVITSPKALTVTGADMVEIAGRSEAGALVRLTINEYQQQEAKADNQGLWSTRIALPDGEHRVTAQAVNVAGAVSGLSAPVSFTVNTDGVVTPKITSPAPGATVANSTIYVTGTGQPNKELEITINGAKQEVTTSKKGIWSVPLVDPSGSYEVQAQQHGRTSEKVRFSVTHQEKKAVPKPTKELLSGVAEPRSSVSIYAHGTYLGSTTTDAQGAWSFSPNVPAGTKQLKVLSTDNKGKVLRVVERAVS